MKRTLSSMKKLLLHLISYYQTCISPAKGGSCCKYIPSCSQYAKEAIERFGAVRGSALAIWRVLRCNPFSKGGVDLVPEKKSKSVKR